MGNRWHSAPASERFWTHVDLTLMCWLWTGTTNPNGYGLFRGSERRNVPAHRYAYELLVGSIPDGMELDHLCRVRHCVNPDHLDPVTHRENVLRGQSLIAANAQKTHCLMGHPFDEENTIWRSDGRVCRICRKAILARYHAKKAAQLAAALNR